MRMLRANPGFAYVAILVLSLGITANTVIFSVVDALVLRHLPYVDADRLVRISEGNDQLKFWGPASYPNFLDWKAQSRRLCRMASLVPESVNVVVEGDADRIRIVRASSELMPLLGFTPIRGRPFVAEDFLPGHTPVVALSHGFWLRRFGSRSDLDLKTMKIEGKTHFVTGVLPPEAKMGSLLGFEPELWIPLIPISSDRGSRSVDVIARLAPGASIEQAQVEMSVIADRLAHQYPSSNRDWKTNVSGLRENVDPIAYVMLFLLVSAILGISCSNVTNLLMVRAAARQKEIAVRVALGAGRWRLVRLLTTEGLLLAFAGAAIGSLSAYVVCRLIRASAAGSNIEVLEIRPDLRTMCFAALLFLASGVLVGLTPALRFSQTSPARSLKEGWSGSSSGPSPRRTGSFLTALEFGLSLMLLVGGGVAIKSWFRLWQVDRGFRSESALVAAISLTEPEYPDSRRQLAFFDELTRRLTSRPGVAEYGLASSLPTMGPRRSFSIPGRPGPSRGGEAQARITSVTSGYLRALSIPLKTGRHIADWDDAGSLPVAMVNETLARRYWDGQNPVGHRIEIAGRPRTIVGVFGDLRNAPLALRPFPEIYLPFSQAAGGRAILFVRGTSAPQEGITELLNKEIRAIDSELPAASVEALEQAMRRDMGVITLGSRVLALLGAGAIGLAAVGLYGMMSYSVARRTSEFGIRLALGARRSDVLRLVMRQAVQVVLAGLAPGVFFSILIVRALSRTLYGIGALEPALLAGPAMVLCCAAMLAAYLPARRATLVDPILALRAER